MTAVQRKVVRTGLRKGLDCRLRVAVTKDNGKGEDSTRRAILKRLEEALPKTEGDG